MRRTDFDSLVFVEVEERAGTEAAVSPHGTPKYYGRPWTQLRDEMLASGARTVRELPTSRVAAYYYSTKSADGSVTLLLQRLFGTASSAAPEH